jgi:hypothetical protein
MKCFSPTWLRSFISIQEYSRNVKLFPFIIEMQEELLRQAIKARRFYFCSEIRMIKSRRIRWAEHVARMGEKRNACRILVGKPRRSRVDNIK